MIVLPTLHKRIRRSFLRLVLLFGSLGVVLLIGISIAGRVPSELIRMNYDSISYAQQLREAMSGVRFPDLYRGNDAQGWDKRFAALLEQASENVTEAEEKQIVADLDAAWQAYRVRPDDGNYRALRAHIDRLVQVNERGMFKRLGRNARFRDLMMLGTAVLFLFGTLWAFLLADGVAQRIAHPLRRAAELFRERPQLGRDLPLPDPQTLEVRLLFDELSRLWDRLGEVDALNVHKLVAEKRKLEVILESVEDGVLVLNKTGMVMLVSRRMLSLLGLPAEGVLGRPWSDLSTSAENYMALREGLRHDLQGTREITLHLGGDERVYAARRRELLAAEGVSTGEVFLLSDVTEKRRRDVLRSEMMDWISHELKTPMQSLGLAADLMARRRGLDEEMSMLVETVGQDAARLRTVARQFMDIARLSPTALRLAPETVDLVARVREWLVPFRLVARESQERLTEDLPDAEILVTIDTERFAWGVANLVSNALRMGKAGSTVAVSVAQAGEEAILCVEDDGPGIPPELEARLFEPFSHGRSAGTRGGLVGLGLAITRDIAEAHGGVIRYARRPEGGSIFTVLLPLAASSGARGRLCEPRPASFGGTAEKEDGKCLLDRQ